jgi:hypothetical protein
VCVRNVEGLWYACMIRRSWWCLWRLLSSNKCHRIVWCIDSNLKKHLLPPPSHTLLLTIVHVTPFIRFWCWNHWCRCCYIICNTFRQTRVSIISVCNILHFSLIKCWYGLIFFQALLMSLLSPTSTFFSHTAIRTFRLILLFGVYIV